MNTEHDLWVERYRPDTLEGYVFKDNAMRDQFMSWIENKSGKKIPIPHLLFSGSPGTGKTTLAKILINVLGVEPGDVMEINASRENRVDDVREKIVGFCSTFPVGKYKIVLLDEVDRYTHDAQGILRAEIERFSDAVRFIMTCNYPKKLMPALHSRMQSFHINKLDMESFMVRMLEILETEGVQYDVEDIQSFIDKSYPDLRKCINLLDQNTRDGRLHPIAVDEESTNDFLEEFIVLFMDKKYSAAREYICSTITQDDYERVYRYFYENLGLFSQTQDGQKQAILVIAQHLRHHAIVADPEINLAACIVQLSGLDE